MNNINHTNHNNNINNGSNTNATTTPTTTLVTTITSTTTTTTTNNIASVSSNNNNNSHNNNHNNNSNSNSNNQNTLHMNATTTNTLNTTAARDATDVNAKTCTESDAPTSADGDENDGSESANDTDNNNDNGKDEDADDDKCDKFMAKGCNQSRQQSYQSDDADRAKDFSESANKRQTKTNTTSTKRQQCQQQTAAALSSAPFEQSNDNNEANSKNTNLSTSGNKSNSTSISTGGNSSSGGSTLSGNATTNFVRDHNLTNNIDYTKHGNSDKQQLLLNITEPHSFASADDKLLNTRTQQKLRFSQRRLRTKALVDSLPPRLKMPAGSIQANFACALALNASSAGDELLVGSNELLQKMSINNPFYRFRKQSTSLKEMRAVAYAERCLRKAHSDTDIFNWQLVSEEEDLGSSGAWVDAQFARAVLAGMGGRALWGRSAQSNGPQKRGETAVQLTAADGSVVVVLDNKHASVVSKPILLSSLEELLDGSITDEATHGSRGYLLDAVAAERAFADTANETDNSTVITNPFSIFHDDDVLMLSVNTRLRAASSASQQQRPLKKRQRSERSIRRLFEASNEAAAGAKRAHATPTNYQTSISARQHYLHGIPVSRFERQDFVSTTAAMTLKEASKSNKLRPKHVFKNLSLRKIHKSASGLPATTHIVTSNACDAVGDLNALPQMKKLKITYPNRTQSIHSALDVSSGTQLSVGLVSPAGAGGGAVKHSYFERLQAKTRQGLQKLRDKCRNFKQAAGHHQHAATGSGFSTLAKDDSFRFIGDRARISSYESKCAALNGSGCGGRQQATIYKSYKSEIDLSKNLHYLDAYLEENFDQQLRSTKQSANSVGRVNAARLQRQKQQLDSSEAKQKRGSPQDAKTLFGRAHKRSLSAAQKSMAATEQRPTPATTTNNYENLDTLPMVRRGCSDSLSSSDYASVFSGPTLAVEPVTPSSAGATEPITPSLVDDASSSTGLRYEHPKMSQYFFNKLDLEGSADLLLATEGHGSSETATCFFNVGSEHDLDDEQGNFDAIGAAGDAALLVDYGRAANLDTSIRILVNEAEDTDFQQELERHLATTKQRRETSATTDWYQQQFQQQLGAADERNFLLAYNENLAESHFYRSLNQHLQQQQKQRQRELCFDANADVNDDDDEANHIGAVITNDVQSVDGSDKDFHYESYLEHFYRARSGRQTRKANSIGYDDERVAVGAGSGVEGEDITDTESGYITRSAFRRAARGRKAGGSAFELRHSAFLLLGENLSNSNDRNKDVVDMMSGNSRAAYYAHQFYGFGGGAAASATQEVGASDVSADKTKLPLAPTNKITAVTHMSGNLANMKGRQLDGLTAAYTRADVQAVATAELKERNERGERFSGSTKSAIDATTNLLGKNIDAYNFAATEAALLGEHGAVNSMPNTHYVSTSGKDNIVAPHVYIESAAKNATAAPTTLAALPIVTAATSPTNLQQPNSGFVKTSTYLQQQQRHERQKLQQQQHQQLIPAPTAAAAALFMDGSKHSGKSGHNMEAALSSGASNRYMLDNMRRQHQQQQHHQQKSANSVSSSLSLSTSSSSNSSVSQPVAHNQQQQLLLSATTAPTQAKYMQTHQQQHKQLPLTTYHARRSSTASNASSSDNFDSFIAVRSAQTTSGIELASPAASTALQPDYAVSTKFSGNSASTYQQQRQQMLSSAHTRAQSTAHYPTSPSSGGSSSTVPLISALNYYGTGSGGGGGGGSASDSTHAAYASSTASASASSSSSSSSTNHKYALTANASAIASNNYALLAQMHYGSKGAGAHSGGTVGGSTCATGPSISPSYASERKPFILEYEC
ncbi:pneumococcal serine-rich repeat protein-like [Anastrepha obliqua]|uniref:pneumococcal serine-rich repeat protein-like n=1 Tax=Anastrepha obliqua TaxID=95512 RepID=UPI00240959FC|nr:pneumococcal serine-rich repeat protein-like [Anastrepha obliqua]